MLDYEALGAFASKCGFSCWAPLKTEDLEFMPEVRGMCFANACGKYGKSWTCPPACGTLDEMREKAGTYMSGILVQTVGTLEDSFDWDSIQETEVRHNRNFFKIWDELEKGYPRLMAMGAGACRNCEVCAYPDEPCRYPQRAAASMEACGLVVSRVCEKSGMPYNHGENTVSFTGCFLLE